MGGTLEGIGLKVKGTGGLLGSPGQQSKGFASSEQRQERNLFHREVLRSGAVGPFPPELPQKATKAGIKTPQQAPAP